MVEENSISANANSSGAPEPQQTQPATNTRRRRLNRRVIWLIAAVLAVIALAVGIPYYLYAVSHESTDDAFIDGRIVSISPRVSGYVERVCVTDNQKVAAGDLLVELDPRDFRARLDAARAALHAAEAAARAQEINVNLTSISTTASLAEKKANVAAADAMVQNARALANAAKSQETESQAQLAYAKASLEQAQAEARAAEADYKQSKSDLRRDEQLAAGNTISHQQMEHARTTERMAAANLDAARSKVATQQSMVRKAAAASKAAQDSVHQAEAQVAARLSELAQAKAQLASARSAPVQVAQSTSQAEAAKAEIAQARAQVEQAQLALSYAKIYAPFAGYVTEKNVEKGAYVQAAQALMAIVSPHVWVTANYKETQLTDMRPGQPATIAVDAYPGVVFHGHVNSIQHGTGSQFSLLPPENATGNYVKVVQRIPVKIVFDRPQELKRYLLAPGMSVVPEVDIKAAPVLANNNVPRKAGAANAKGKKSATS